MMLFFANLKLDSRIAIIHAKRKRHFLFQHWGFVLFFVCVESDR
jgi:hypothetical protein